MDLENISTQLRKLRNVARKKYNAEIIGIFGSYARGEQDERSDIDVLVRFLEGATLFDLIELANFLEEKLNVKVDVVPIDGLREEIKENILADAVYL